MGNTPSGESLALESNPNLSYKIKLGTFACIRVDKRTLDTNEFGEAVEKQSMSYEVYDRACNLTLTKTRPLPAAAAGNGNNRGQKFIISISEMGYSVVDLTSRDNLITCTTKDGGITESCIHRYQGFYRHNAQGLIVLQLKKKGRDQSAYLVAVAHYFVHLGRADTGLSLVARILATKVCSWRAQYNTLVLHCINCWNKPKEVRVGPERRALIVLISMIKGSLHSKKKNRSKAV